MKLNQMKNKGLIKATFAFFIFVASVGVFSIFNHSGFNFHGNTAEAVARLLPRKM